jgi:hypothetical protein
VWRRPHPTDCMKASCVKASRCSLVCLHYSSVLPVQVTLFARDFNHCEVEIDVLSP